MHLTEDQIDLLAEMMNIGVGRAAASLNELLGLHIELTVPQVAVCSLHDLPRWLVASGELLDTSVMQEFKGAVSGQAYLAFPRLSGLNLGHAVGGLEFSADQDDLDFSGVLIEIGNIVLNAVLGSMGNMFSTPLSYCVPEYVVGNVVEFLEARCQLESGRMVLVSDAHFSVSQKQINGSILIAVDLHDLSSMMTHMLVAAS